MSQESNHLDKFRLLNSLKSIFERFSHLGNTFNPFADFFEGFVDFSNLRDKTFLGQELVLNHPIANNKPEIDFENSIFQDFLEANLSGYSLDDTDFSEFRNLNKGSNLTDPMLFDLMDSILTPTKAHAENIESFKVPNYMEKMSAKSLIIFDELVNSISFAGNPFDDVVNISRGSLKANPGNDLAGEIFLTFAQNCINNLNVSSKNYEGMYKKSESYRKSRYDSLKNDSVNRKKSLLLKFGESVIEENLHRDDLEMLFIFLASYIGQKDDLLSDKLRLMVKCAVPDLELANINCNNMTNELQILINSDVMPRETLETLFVKSLELLIDDDNQAGTVSHNTVDDRSSLAVTNFRSLISSERFTLSDLTELFIRFTREISNKCPSAKAELEQIFVNALFNLYNPDLTMDTTSRMALDNFKSNINSVSMTREELVELFLRFSREISNQYPIAFSELEQILLNAITNAYKPDAIMDDVSRQVLSGFAQIVKPDFMIREDLEELFLRFSREISNKYPDAMSELLSILANAVAVAHKPDLTMDDGAKSAVTSFANAIKPDSMTREVLEELFLRFIREVSVKYPAAWAEMEGMLSIALANAFKPTTTIDDSSSALVEAFSSTVHTQSLSGHELENIFSVYLRSIPAQFVEAKSRLENLRLNKKNDSYYKDLMEHKTEKDYYLIEKSFKEIVNVSDTLNLAAEAKGKELKNASTKEEIDVILQDLRRIELNKSVLDILYSDSMVNINSNDAASIGIKDDYTQKLAISFDMKDDRELFEITSQELTNWDMVRMLRREEVLDVLDEIPKEQLAESLYVIPKFMLKQALVQLPLEQMCEVLLNARFAEALLRDMPRSKAIELLPSPEEMLPILMMLGNVGGFKNGCDLLEEVITKGLKVQGEQNETRTQEELLPFIMEQLIGKTPRNADASKKSDMKKSPIKVILAELKAASMDKSGINTGGKREKMLEKAKYDSPEFLKPVQLAKLSEETIKNQTDDESRNLLAAKRGDSSEILQFLESMKKVKDYAGAKMAVSVLTVSQTNTIAKAVLPMLETKHLVKISQYYGAKSSDEMVKEMPRYTITNLIKNLPKYQMIEGFKLLDKDIITGLLKTQSSQTIARVATEMLSRDTIKTSAFNKQGFV